MATDIMILAAFGVEPGSGEGLGLKAAYDRLGFLVPSNVVGAGETRAFSDIVSILQGIEQQLAQTTESLLPSFIGHLVSTKSLDDTLRGNLVYMVDTARFDLASLLRWILYYLAPREDVTRKARGDSDSYLDAVIYETLRLNQSEFLRRRVSEDIAFEGYLIPKDTLVRVCLWEGHKNAETFPEPFAFQPERFVEKDYSIDQFSPFGLDKHRCLGPDFTLDATRIVIKTLVQGYALAGVNIGEPRRGIHHWEPNTDFTIALSPLTKPKQL